MSHSVIARQQYKAKPPRNPTGFGTASPESDRFRAKPKQSRILDCFVGLRPPRNDGALFVLIFILFFSSSLFALELPTYKTVPEFSFTDQHGNSLSNSDLNGKVWIANFVFTRCQAMCPLLTGRMAILQEKLNSDNIKLISFSVDPEHDTPEVLSRYAASHKAAEGKWFFVTTSEKTKMWDFISGGFMLGVGEPTADELAQGAEPVMHTNRFVLVDQTGNIRGYYDSEEPAKMEALVRDALSL